MPRSIRIMSVNDVVFYLINDGVKGDENTKESQKKPCVVDSSRSLNAGKLWIVTILKLTQY